MVVAERPRIEIAKHLPPGRITNEWLANYRVKTKYDDFSDPKKIEEKLGIVVRPRAGVDVDESSMGIAAGRGLQEKISGDVDYLLYSMSFPQENDPLRNFEERYNIHPQFDRYYHAACSGAVFALTDLKDREADAQGKRFVLVASEIYTDKMEDPNVDLGRSMFIFGDGAAGMTGVYGEDINILHYRNFADFTQEEREAIRMPIDYRRLKTSPTGFEPKIIASPTTDSGKLEMDGGKVLKIMLNTVPSLVRELVDEAGLNPEDIKLVVPHQASRPMLERTEKQLPEYAGRFYSRLRGGNISSATILLGLEDLMNTGRVLRGDKLILLGFGAGLSVSAAIAELG